jgi:CheY-like chemotaxis protein
VETILVVDDEPEVLAVAVDMLEAKGYTILHTGDPLEALRIART